jgi:hypothetical protein
MGLLDDAIREHLELKRLKGADPGDVAREEREALGKGGTAEQAGAEAYEGQVEHVGPGHDDDGQATELGGPPAHGAAGQETIELDMESVLASRPRSTATQADSGDEPTPVHQPSSPSPDTGESLEWEMPAEQGPGEPVENLESGSEDEPVEDVLEETPDFLRETPEQDRLWFEQRPPRDFDFNE